MVRFVLRGTDPTTRYNSDTDSEEDTPKNTVNVECCMHSTMISLFTS